MNKKHCSSCAICIGPEFMERIAYPIGDYELCGSCYNGLKRNGHAELDGRFLNKCDWLYPDGSVVRMRIITDGTDVRFLPIKNIKEATDDTRKTDVL